ncbi:MAG: patatin-like phospholipase family protein [Alphaproteobacteria bacterium]|nr:patatin-like phospholipase family protein [Alphaproteobacteria bacterium]
MPRQNAQKKSVSLALQGGGAHGAFTWGAVDRFLECEKLGIEAVTGASAGAMNAVALADGLADGSRQEARERLAQFWDEIAKAGTHSPFQRTPFDVFVGNWALSQSPVFLWWQSMSAYVSPYDSNPFDINPLLESICDVIDFERVRRSPVKTLITATNVETGRSEIFQQSQLTAKHLMASACLPQLFKAVEIDGVPYWDGGYMGNPPLWPLFEKAVSDDVIIIRVNPFHQEGVPRSAPDINDRLNEITFNASLIGELRAIDFVSRLIAAGRLKGTGYRDMHLHMIEDEVFLESLGASSKFNVSHSFFKLLFDKGREAADRFLEKHFDVIGKRATVDLKALFGREKDSVAGMEIASGSLPARYSN